MANIYYPQSSQILQRVTSGSGYTEILISVAPNVIFFFDTSSQFLNAMTASAFALTSSWSENSKTSSYSLTNSGNTQANARTIVLCGGFTPDFYGPDVLELSVPYAVDGTSSVNWNVSRLNMRVQIAGTTGSIVNIEKSSSTGSFSAVTVGTLFLNSQSYETNNEPTSSMISGDKMRFNVISLGDAQYWTISTEIYSL